MRECAGGDAGETLLFPLLLLGRSLRPPGPRPTPPGTLGSVVSAPFHDRLPREGSGGLAADLNPTAWACNGQVLKLVSAV